MEFAISIYKGGKRVYPKDCNFVSYSEQGLICPICKQEVYLRKGNIREPYFAHFHATSSRKVEECELRVSADGNSTETSSFIENRGQRLEIFQQHFLSLIYFGNSRIIEDVKFNNWINSRKYQSNQIINNIIIKRIDYFIKNWQSMKAKYIIHTTKIKNKQALLQQKISLEVMIYLCENAKFNYNLRYLFFYSMYQIYKYEEHKLIRQNIKTQDIEKICQYTVRIIMRNSWILAFKNTKINEVNNTTQHNIIKINKNRISCTSSPLQIFLQDIEDATKGKSTKNINSLTINVSELSSVECNKLKSPLPLNHIFSAIQYGSRGRVKKVIVSCKLVTEINTDENTAIQFSFMVNELIKVDSRIQNASGNYVKVETEIWHPAIVYSFGYDLTLTIETYSDLLFPKGGHLEEYTNITKRDELASLFQALLLNGKINLLETYEDSKGKVRINYAYDCSILLLCELLEHCHLGLGFKYEPIEFNTVMQCIINAADKATKSGMPLINGMLLHSLFTAAKEQLNSSQNKTITVPVKITVNEVKHLTQNNLSVYSDTPMFNVGDTVWLNTKGQRSGKTHRCKVMITKILDNNHYEVMGKDKFKYPVSGKLLSEYQ
jgi:hypothetical protein